MSTDLTSPTALTWTNPEAGEEKPTLIRLSPDNLFLSVVARPDLDRTIDLLNKGESVAGQIVPLSAIAMVEGVEEEADLEVHYIQGESKPETASLTLADATQRDELLTALTGALGPEWIEERRPQNRFVVALWPVGVMVGVGLLTWFMYDAAQLIAAGRQLKMPAHGKARLVLQFMHWIEGLIGATGVLILGSVLGALCFCWLFAVLAKPPVKIIVQKRGEK